MVELATKSLDVYPLDAFLGFRFVFLKEIEDVPTQLSFSCPCAGRTAPTSLGFMELVEVNRLRGYCRCSLGKTLWAFMGNGFGIVFEVGPTCPDWFTDPGAR